MGDQCIISSYPHQVRMPSIALMTLNIRSTPEFSLFEDAVTGVSMSEFSFLATVTDPIDPQKCHWLPISLDHDKIYIKEADDSYTDLRQLSSEFAMPDLLCMRGNYLKPGHTSPGNPIGAGGSMPLFRKQGFSLDPSDSNAQGLYNECYDLSSIQSNKLVQWTGVTEMGTTKVLECQSGDPTDLGFYNMVPLFQIACPDAKEAQLTYQEVYAGKGLSGGASVADAGGAGGAGGSATESPASKSDSSNSKAENSPV